MKKIYTHMEYTHVGHFQSVLEDEGIQTTVKNKGASIGMGEIPFIEIWPELWVINDSDFKRAEEILHQVNTISTQQTAAWTCPECGNEIEENFAECWKCGHSPKS